MDLTGLAALASSIPGGFQQGQMNQQQLIAQKLANARTQEQLRQSQLEDQANVAAGLGLIDDTSHYQAPGGAPQPQAPPTMGAGPMPASPGGPAPMAAPGGAPAPGGPAPAPAPASAPGGGGSAPSGIPLDPYTIAARIKKANPGISPAALFKAVGQTVSMLGPMAQNQYREDMLNLRYQLQAQQLEERIREADQKYQQGADRVAVQQEALNIRMQIAQLQQQGMNDRSLLRLTQQVDALAAKAGVAPTGDRATDLKNTADANAGKTAAKDAGSAANAAYSEAAAERSKVNSQIQDVLRENGGMLPAPGSDGRRKYDALVRQRDTVAQRMIDARKKNPKLPGFDNQKNALDADTGGQTGTKDSPAKPTTQAEYDALPSGAYFQDDEGVKQKP